LRKLNKLKYNIFLVVVIFVIILLFFIIYPSLLSNRADNINLQNGIYLECPTNNDDNCVTITDVRGNEVSIRRNPIPIIEDVVIYSRNNNNNTGYELVAFIGSQEVHSSNKLRILAVLKVNNKYYPFVSSGGEFSKELNIDKNFIHSIDLTPEEATSIAQHFNIPRSDRTHFGCELKGQFTPLSDHYPLTPSYLEVGEILVEFKIKNTGEVPFDFERGFISRLKGGGYRISRRGIGIDFKIYFKGKIQEDSGPWSEMGSIMHPRTPLNPGQSESLIYNLKNWGSFDKPGRYEVHGLAELTLSIPSSGYRNALEWFQHEHEQWDVKYEQVFYINIVESE